MKVLHCHNYYRKYGREDTTCFAERESLTNFECRLYGPQSEAGSFRGCTFTSRHVNSVSGRAPRDHSGGGSESCVPSSSNGCGRRQSRRTCKKASVVISPILAKTADEARAASVDECEELHDR